MELNKKTINRLILGAAGCILLFWMLHETDRVKQILRFGYDLLSPFLIGACIAFVLNVPMRAIERLLQKHTKLHQTRGLAILATLAVLVLVVTVVVNMLIPQIGITCQAIADQIPGFLRRTEAALQEIMDDNPQIMELLVEYTDVENINWSALVEQVVDVLGKSISTIFSSTVSALGNVFSAVWDLVVSLIFSLYCLSNKDTLARQGKKLLYAIFPERAADQVLRVARLTNATFSKFLSGQCIEVCILGTMFAVSMTIFSMPYVSLVSVLVAVTAFIPIVGAWIGCVLGAFFILVNDPMQALWFVVLFLVLQQIENNLIYPKVVGSSIGLPSMWVLFSVSIGGTLMGVAGMLVMIPLSSVMYTLLREFAATRVAEKAIPPEKLGAPDTKSESVETTEESK